MDDPPVPEFEPNSEDLLQLIKPDLQPGERLLWAGRAGVNPWSAPGEGSASPWIWACGFATVGAACLLAFPALVKPVASREWVDSWVMIIGIVSLIIGFLTVAGTFGNWVDARTTRKADAGQVYALTDRRAIIWVPDRKSPAVTVHTFPKGTIKDNELRRVQYPDGSGDVILRGLDHGPGVFRGIADVRRVEELVRRFLVPPPS